MLNGGNWLEWSAGMKAYLCFVKLWPYVSGTKEKPKEITDTGGNVTNQVERDAWDDMDEQAVGAMLMRVPHQYHHLALDDDGDDEDSSTLWDNIET